MPAQNKPSKLSMRGFTLIELMVSVAIGLVALLAVSYTYVGSKQTFRVQEALSRMQENARFIFETMTYDIRMAGFTGCGNTPTVANTLNNSTDWDKNIFGAPLVGYEEGESTYPDGVNENVLRGDALTVLRGDGSDYTVDSHNASAASIQLTENHDIKQGEILIITDCVHTAVFQMTNVNSNDTIAVVDHHTGEGNQVSPGNCTKGLGDPLDCSSTNGTPYGFPPGSKILRMSGVNYHLRTNANNEPTLFRTRLATSGGDATRVADELAEGVEDMQIEYGVDADDNDQVEQYVAANAVVNWAKVIAVRISLLMVSPGDGAYTTAAQTYTFNGTETTPTDRRLRKVFDTTIAIRNRLDND